MPDYTFYRESYLGEDIPEAQFPRFIRQAGAELARMLTQAGAKARSCSTIPQGVALARELAGPEGAVLAFGSLYSIGAIREALEA